MRQASASAALDSSGVDHGAGGVDGVEEQFVTVDLHGHERAVGVEPSCRDRAFLVQVALPQLAARADDEMRKALLRLGPFVEVLMTGEDDGDVAGEEQGLERRTEVHVRPVAAARRIERMVEVRNDPLVAARELFRQPRDLLRRRVVAFDGDELHVPRGASKL